MYSQDSIDLLASSGLQFQKHEEEGIDTLHFAELLMTSGVVLSDSVKWLSFHRLVCFFSICQYICLLHLIQHKTGIVCWNCLKKKVNDLANGLGVQLVYMNLRMILSGRKIAILNI